MKSFFIIEIFYLKSYSLKRYSKFLLDKNVLYCLSLKGVQKILDKIRGLNFLRIAIRESPYGIPIYGEECKNLWGYDTDGRLVVKAHGETGRHQLDSLYGKFSGCYEIVDDFRPGDEVMWVDEDYNLHKGKVVEEGEPLLELWGKMELQQYSFSPISKNYKRIYRKEPAEEASVNFMSMDKAELDSLFVKVDYQGQIYYIPKYQAIKLNSNKYQISSDNSYQISDIKCHESENQQSDINEVHFIFEVETFYMNGREIIKHQHYPYINIKYRSKTFFPTENEAFKFMANPPEVFPRESETIYCHFLRRIPADTIFEESRVKAERFPKSGDLAVGDIVEYYDEGAEVKLRIIKEMSANGDFTLLNEIGSSLPDVPALYLAKPRFKIPPELQGLLQSFL